MSITDAQYSVLGSPNGLIRCQRWHPERFIEKNDQNLPFGCTKYWIVSCTNKMPCSTCYFELSSFWKPECKQIELFKYANLLIHVFERCMWSFSTCFQLEVARWGYGTLGGHRLTKQPDYLVFLHAFIASYNFLAKCIWSMKSIWVVFMHVWKKPLEYWGMIPSLSGPLGPQKGGKSRVLPSCPHQRNQHRHRHCHS